MTTAEPEYRPRSERPPHRRALLHVTSEQIAALLRLPDDVTVVTFDLDPVRDAITFALQSDRFAPVVPGGYPPTLTTDHGVTVDGDGAVTLHVAWPDLEGAGFAIRTPAPDGAEF